MKRFRTNAMIFLVAVGLAVVLFYFTENPNFFSASILSLQDAETMQANSWDIGYKNENKILDVFLAKRIKDINYISLSVVYDQKDISFDLQKIDSQTKYEILSNDGGILVIRFYDFKNYDYQKSLFELAFNGDLPSILLSEGAITQLNGENKNLSIGLLNQDSDIYHGF